MSVAVAPVPRPILSSYYRLPCSRYATSFALYGKSLSHLQASKWLLGVTQGSTVTLNASKIFEFCL
jgi:hypothetical protein